MPRVSQWHSVVKDFFFIFRSGLARVYCVLDIASSPSTVSQGKGFGCALWWGETLVIEPRFSSRPDRIPNHHSAELTLPVPILVYCKCTSANTPSCNNIRMHRKGLASFNPALCRTVSQTRHSIMAPAPTFFNLTIREYCSYCVHCFSFYIKWRIVFIK
jgi:hypothetical protein